MSPDLEPADELTAERVRRIAAALPYPATPDLAGGVRRRLSERVPAPTLGRRLSFGLAALLVILLASLLVSPVRARVLEWIRIGSVRIFFGQPTATVTIQATAMPAGSAARSLTPTPSPTPLRSVLDLAGETTLVDAQEQAGFPIRLPGEPADLGQPDRVFFQHLGGDVVVLVWLVPDQPEVVRMSLSQSSSGRMIFEKYDPIAVQDTRVGEHAAVWVDGDYLLAVRSGDAIFTRLVNQGHTLIWSDGEMTYRLETDADLETALEIAGSIR